MSQSSKNTKNSSLTLFKHHFLGFVLEINNDEVARIQQLNQEYMEQKDIVEIINLCFRKPEEGDAVQAMNSTELLRYMRNKYPSLPDNLSTRIRLGQAMSSLDFDSTSRGHVSYYRVALVKQETKAVKAA